VRRAVFDDLRVRLVQNAVVVAFKPDANFSFPISFSLDPFRIFERKERVLDRCWLLAPANPKPCHPEGGFCASRRTYVLFTVVPTGLDLCALDPGLAPWAAFFRPFGLTRCRHSVLVNAEC